MTLLTPAEQRFPEGSLPFPQVCLLTPIGWGQVNKLILPDLHSCKCKLQSHVLGMHPNLLCLASDPHLSCSHECGWHRSSSTCRSGSGDTWPSITLSPRDEVIPFSSWGQVSLCGRQMCEPKSLLPVPKSAPCLYSAKILLPLSQKLGAETRLFTLDRSHAPPPVAKGCHAQGFPIRASEQSFVQAGVLFNSWIWKCFQLDAKLSARNLRRGKSGLSFSEQILNPNSLSAWQRHIVHPTPAKERSHP